ncbi:hypothetical protein LUZ60_013722 [Juncus effusus]|nr:hypothetical protein LUZ60_013722 [Juncus effusus]
MAEIEEVIEMTRERGDVVIDILDANTDIFEEEDPEITTPTVLNQFHAYVQQKLDAVPGKPMMYRHITIFRVPALFHEASKTYYQPQLVSIGPYHQGKESLRAMEEYKWSTLRDFLSRNEKVHFNIYFEEIRDLEMTARLCYSENVNMTSDEFVMMLILDGCFILEYFLKKQCRQLDTLLDASWVDIGLDSDLLLLENQIPFFIIHKLFDINSGYYQDCRDNCFLLKLIAGFQYRLALGKKIKPHSVPCDQMCHLLHFYHKSLVAEVYKEQQTNHVTCNQSRKWSVGMFSSFLSQLMDVASKKQERDERAALKKQERDERANQSMELQPNGNQSFALGIGTFSWFPAQSRHVQSGKHEIDESANKELKDGEKTPPQSHIPCVSELHNAGVSFKRKINPRHMFDITFQNGIMEMPLMQIDASVKIILTNLVAFEQSQRYHTITIFNSYLALMDILVNTEKDVALLQQSGILENFLQNEEDASVFYNHFADFSSMSYKNLYYGDLLVNVRRYIDSTWPKYRVKLMHDYFNNPWATISVVAGGFLLIFTALQTYFTVVSGIHK